MVYQTKRGSVHHLVKVAKLIGATYMEVKKSNVKDIMFIVVSAQRY
jgi:hypothetical protein